MMRNPDGQSFNGTVTFGAPMFLPLTITGSPFSAEEMGSQTQVLPDGNKITRAVPSTFLFRDSAGRTRTERPAMMMAPNSKLAIKLPLIPEICDPVTGYQYFLDTANRIAHRYALPPSNNNQFRIDGPLGANLIRSNGDPQTLSPAFVNEPLGSQMIEGIPAQGRRTTAIFPAGMMDNDQPMATNSEYWTSVELKVTLLSKQYDPRGGESIRALINISRNEPDSSLFQVPSDYKVVEETGVFTITFSAKLQ